MSLKSPRDSSRLASGLRQLGIQHWPSTREFPAVKIGQQHREFVSAMRQRGILVRDRSADPGCDGCVRITVGISAQTEQLIAAMKEFFAELNLGRSATA